MRFPRTAVAALVLIATAVVVPLLGVGVALSVRPSIQAAPPVVLDDASRFEAMPVGPAKTQSLAGLFDALPIVDPGSGSKARPFFVRYGRSVVDDPKSMSDLVAAAMAEIRVKGSARTVTDAFLSRLVSEDPDVEVDTNDEGVTAELGDAAFKSLARRAMPAIAAIPANAVALNDLAVAIFVASASGTVDDRSSLDGKPLASYVHLRQAAPTLLELGIASFPDDRAMNVNLAFMHSLDETFGTETEPSMATLGTYVGRAPADVTARSLLADLLVRTDADSGLDRAIAVVDPLIDGAKTEAAGHLVLGDTLLRAAERGAVESAFTSRSLATRALGAYDQAIELSGDPAAFAGRASALDLLGWRAGAAAALREAVDRAGSSIAGRLHLADLEACAGENPAWLKDAQAALRLASKTKATPLAGLRFVPDNATDRGHGGYSFDSGRLASGLTVADTQGGASVVTLDPFPESETCLTADVRSDTVVETAATEAWLAAMAGGETATARQVLATWQGDIPAADPASPDDEAGSDIETPGELGKVMDLLDGGLFNPDDDPIASFTDLAHRLPPEVEGRVCSTLAAAITGKGSDFSDDVVTCVAEAAHRRGDDAAAAAAIEPIIRLDDHQDPARAVAVLQSGMLNELAGHLDIAHDRYEAAATLGETTIAGLQRLGDLDLREADPMGALDHYELAIAAIRSQVFADPQYEIDEVQAKPLRHQIDNNRGIALLMTARTETDRPPDCTAFAAICAQAREAFDAAAAADPENPVYAMNQAWVARLTGDVDKAIAKYREALSHGTPLGAPVHNDLGVLAAGRGDLAEARTQFVVALSLQPGYDLAIWNLGVLDAREAGPVLTAGQALLAEAGRQDRDLRSSEMSFRTDERVYRVEVNGTQLELARAPGTGAAIGAAAFGVIATAGAIGQLIASLGGDVEEAAGAVATEGLLRRRPRWLRLGGRVRLGMDGDRRWWRSSFAWIPSIVVLFVTTAWTANWLAPDAFGTALLIGLCAAAVALAVHACGHLVVAGRMGAALQPSRWDAGIALALIGMPFHVPAGPFLAERITTEDPSRDWWVSFAGVFANLAAAGFAFLLYLAYPMPFLRVLIATQLAVAAFALIPSHPLDGDRLATRPIVLALIGLGVAAASTAIAVGAI